MATHSAGERRYTPPTIARRFNVDCNKVLRWIKSGELRALNIATSRTQRPRYSVAESDLLAFEAARSVIPTPKPSRRRKSDTANVTQYF